MALGGSVMDTFDTAGPATDELACSFHDYNTYKVDQQRSAVADRCARRAASRPSCCTQRWTLSVINWRPTTVASLSH